MLQVANFMDSSGVETNELSDPSRVTVVPWGPPPLPGFGGTCLELHGRVSSREGAILGGLEHLYVHRLMAAPQTFKDYLASTRCFHLGDSEVLAAERQRCRLHS